MSDSVRVFKDWGDKCRILLGNNFKDKMEVHIPITGNFFKRFKKCLAILFGEDPVVYEEFEFTSNDQRDEFIIELRKTCSIATDEVFKVQLLNNASFLPVKGTRTSAGFDLTTPVDFELRPGQQTLVPLGFRMAISPGYEVQIRSRSSIPYKYNCMISNGIGTIDEDYRGEFKVMLFNYGRDTVAFKRGEKIAQMVVKKTENVRLEAGQVSTNTERGEGGFGSTGK